MTDRAADRLTNFLGGLVSGVTAITLTSPLDIARTRYQIQNVATSNKKKYLSLLHSFGTIFKEEGVSGYFKGYSAAIVAMPLFYSLYFSTYHHLRDSLNNKLPEWAKKYSNVTSAALTNLLCDAVTSPLWVVRMRLQTQYLYAGNNMKYKGFFNTIGIIHREEGIRAFYRGILTSAFGVVHSAIFLPLYEYLRDDLLHNTTEHESLNVVLSTSIAKTVASAVTYPQTILRATLQANIGMMEDGKGKGPSIKEITKRIWKAYGMKGFYQGFTMDMLRILPVNATVFFIFEMSRKFFNNKLTTKTSGV